LEHLVHHKGFRSIRKSRLSAEGHGDDNSRIILLDTMGELYRLYAAADIAFVGGSLIPRGGHNVLEPAMHGKPVLFGPHMDNFRDSARLLETHGIGFPVGDVSTLANRITSLLDDEDELLAVRHRARIVIEQNRGASQRIARLVERLLAKVASGDSPYRAEGGEESPSSATICNEQESKPFQ